MSKYDPLTKHLKSLNKSEVLMTFADIEEVIGAKLPPSAFKHRPWWSNNPSNSVITYAWLRAGYKTTSVDMEQRKLIFEKQEEKDERGSDLSTFPTARSFEMSSGMREKPSAYGHSDREKPMPTFMSIYGCMKGTIKIMPGLDITKPVSTDEEWDEIESESERKWNEMVAPDSNKKGAA